MSSTSSKSCAICLDNVKTGFGQAIFTAECSHSFHLSCISKNVQHGNNVCPICRSKWNRMPVQFFGSNFNPIVNSGSAAPGPPAFGSGFDFPQSSISSFAQPQPQPRLEPLHFNDDEALPAPSTLVAPADNVIIKASPQTPAIAALETDSKFAVLVCVRAPSLLDDEHRLGRAPIDLVTVLDVSGSMLGSKLALLKTAVCFVIDNLEPSDRLSIVTFSTRAHRIFPLRRMTESGREDAKQAVSSISANGNTNIVEGLKKGVKVLEERRESNPVASIIFLSDGNDTCNYGYNTAPSQPQTFGSRISSWQFMNQHQNSHSPSFSSKGRVPAYLNLLPVSICPRNGGGQDKVQQPRFSVHTFGFGTDHDPAAMHAIADASGGTFSFIESVAVVQDAFAMCIGGLLSVVVQDLRLTVTSASPGVKIESIPSGRHANVISERGQQGVVIVGDMYADEEKDFLVYMSLPVSHEVEGEDGGVGKTPLLDLTCCYRDAVSEKIVTVQGERVEIRRPMTLSSEDSIVSLEVDRQGNRLLVAEGIAEARKMAETGNLEDAKAALASRRSALMSSPSAQAGDGLSNWLDAELREIQERMESVQLYESSGRSYILAGMSSHASQRATTRGNVALQSFGLAFGSSGVGYETASMVNMVNKSQNQSKVVQPPLGDEPPQ